MQSVVQTTDQTPTGRMSAAPGARRALAGGLVGAVMVGSALLGSGTASAAPNCNAPILSALVAKQCQALKTTVSGATGAVKTVPKKTAPVVQAVPKVVASAPKAATGAVGGVVGGTSKAATPSKAAAVPSGSTGSAAGSSSSPAGGTEAAAAPATAAPAAAWTSTPVAATSAMTYTAAFDSLPASFMSSAAPGMGVSALGGFGGATYDPGLLLTSATPLRALAPSPVTSGSTASPMSFLSDDGQFGTPVLLSVLSVAVVAALGVRSGVLRRARRRGGASA